MGDAGDVGKNEPIVKDISDNVAVKCENGSVTDMRDYARVLEFGICWGVNAYFQLVIYALPSLTMSVKSRRLPNR